MSEGTQAFLVVLILVALALLIPSKYDPAIRIKEWQMGWKDKGKGSYHDD
jgi:hypothetical protein